MKFKLKINGSESPEAAYVGWTPVRCTLEIEGYDGQSPMPVTITPEHKNKSGRIDLYLDNATSATPVQKIEHNFQSENELTFYVAGKFDHASVAQKDTFIRVKHFSGAIEKLERDLMVRVRKNANKLDPVEVKLFLETFVRLNTEDEEIRKKYEGRYTAKPSALLHEIVLMHTYDTASEIHSRESFHPWHRAYLMHLEREMQDLNPEVTIPYWKFDEKADKVFTEEFIGKTKKSNPDDEDRLHISEMPVFSCNNPLNNYKDHTVWGPLTRSYQETDPAVDKPYSRINDESDVISFSSEFIEWCRYEERTSHNQAHNAFNGRVVDIGKDPVDPLFFMMHSNVDRLWALWQQVYDRYDSEDIKTYPIPYSFRGNRGDEWADANPEKLDRRASFYQVSSYDLGNFADDELWPWGMYKEKDEKNSDGSPKDIVDRLSRPWRKYSDSGYGAAIVPELFLRFPESLTSDLPEGPPRVRDTIDYQGRVSQKSGLGFDYDNIPYFDKDKEVITPTPITRESYNDAFLNDQLSVEERLAAARNAFLFSDEDQDAALKIIEDTNSDPNIQIIAVGLVSEAREEFLDSALKVIKNEDELYSEDLIFELIHKIYTAKRSNPNFASRRPFFFDILRGLLTTDKVKLRHQAFDILASQGDSVSEDILLAEVDKVLENKRDEKTMISPADALFLLRQNSKNQHMRVFRKLASGNYDEEIRKAAIEGLGNDLESIDFLKSVVSGDTNDSFKIRGASALALNHLDMKTMNELAAQIISKPEMGDGIKLFRSVSPDPDEVDFKAGLLNMLTFTGDVDQLKENESLKSSLRELLDLGTQNKANFRSTLEAETVSAVPVEGPVIIEQLAAELLDRFEGDGNA